MLFSQIWQRAIIALLICLYPVGGHQAHQHDEQLPLTPDAQELLKKWGQEWSFAGISTFAHLQHVKCLVNTDELYDIAIIGAPFDTAVSYRPGARFGPRAIRAASSRQMPALGYNPRAGINPYLSWARILDCGDIPVVPFDNGIAERQMYESFLELGTRSTPKDGRPKLVTLGGDHSVALPALRALYKIYKRPIAVVHFDAHLDTWDTLRYSSVWTSERARFTHGSFFHTACLEGLISNTSSVHAGLRTRLTGTDDGDYRNPGPEQSFLRIHADDIDDIGVKGVIDSIISRVGLDPDQPVYLSLDIDVLDPSIAPGTGTPEPGGWTTRELIRILRGIEKLNIVGADIVEVSPTYDGHGEGTALAAAQMVYELLASMVKLGLRENTGGWYGKKGQKTRDEL